MTKLLPLCSLVVAAGAAGFAIHAPAQARSAEFAASGAQELPAYLQCVPYARELTGIGIYGDAHTWWAQAEGRYERGHVPKVGAVMAFRPSGAMQLGHVAAVSKVIDSRTLLLDHANWSPIDGRRGQIERGVRAVDVSPGNDWSSVRVWYHPLQALGKTAWPVYGFIYARSAMKTAPFVREAAPKAPARVAVARTPSPSFMNAFSGVAAAPSARPVRVPKKASQPYRKAPPLASRQVASQQQGDPFASVISQYDPTR